MSSVRRFPHWRRPTMLLVGMLVAAAMVVWGWDRIVLGNASVVFYGRVVDGDGKGIAGVQVKMMVSHSQFFSVPVPFQKGPETTEEIIVMTTDQSGDFGVIRCRGYSVNIAEIRKPGLIFEK